MWMSCDDFLGFWHGIYIAQAFLGWIFDTEGRFRWQCGVLESIDQRYSKVLRRTIQLYSSSSASRFSPILITFQHMRRKALSTFRLVFSDIAQRYFSPRYTYCTFEFQPITTSSLRGEIRPNGPVVRRVTRTFRYDKIPGSIPGLGIFADFLRFFLRILRLRLSTKAIEV